MYGLYSDAPSEKTTRENTIKLHIYSVRTSCNFLHIPRVTLNRADHSSIFLYRTLLSTDNCRSLLHGSPIMCYDGVVILFGFSLVVALGYLFNDWQKDFS